MAGIDTMTPYRDPRTAFGGNVTAARPRIPVGEVTEFFGGAQPGPAQAQPAPAAAPAAAGTAARTPRRDTMPRAGIGALGPAAGVALGAAPEALDVGRVLAAPGATGIDVATQAAEGTGRLASAGAGAMGGAKLGAMAAPFLGPLAPAGPVAGSILGGLAGYFSADKAIKGGRAAVGADPTSPVDRIPVAPAGAPVGIGDIPQAAAGAADMAVRRGAARDAASSNDQFIGLPVVTGPAPGTIAFDPKTKTYSGTDVKAGAEITGGTGTGRGTGRMGVTVLPGSPGGFGPNSSLGGMDTALSEARSAAAARGDFGSIGAMPSQSFGDGGNTVGQAAGGFSGKSLMKDANERFNAGEDTGRQVEAMTRSGSSRERLQAAGISSQRQASELGAETARRGQDIGAFREQAALDGQRDVEAGRQKTQRDIAALQGNTQREVATIGAEGRTEAAAARGSERARYTPIKLPDEVSPDGMTTRNMGTALLNNDTGEIVYPGQGTGLKPSAPPAGAVQKLRADPKLAADFDAKYGKGAAAAVLGQ